MALKTRPMKRQTVQKIVKINPAGYPSLWPQIGNKPCTNCQIVRTLCMHYTGKKLPVHLTKSGD